MAPEHIRVSHVGICVSDMERSIRFYRDGLGFEVAEGYDLDDSVLPGLAEALEVAAPVAIRDIMSGNNASHPADHASACVACGRSIR